MTLQNPDNNEKTPNLNIDWDNVLGEVQEKLGPSENIPENETQPQTAESHGQDGECLRCSYCKNMKLWFPDFQPIPYFLPIIHWINNMITPIMASNMRCFPCVMMYILHNPQEFNIIDQCLAEKMMVMLPDLINMPMRHLHGRPAATPNSENTENTENSENSENPQNAEKPEISREAPKGIRNVLRDFKQNQENP